MLQAPQIGEDPHALGKNRLPRERQPILGEIPGADTPGDAQAAVVNGLQSAQNFEHGGLAGPVGPDQANTVLSRNQPVDVLKQELVGITLARGRKVDHDL